MATNFDQDATLLASSSPSETVASATTPSAPPSKARGRPRRKPAATAAENGAGIGADATSANGAHGSTAAAPGQEAPGDSSVTMPASEDAAATTKRRRAAPRARKAAAGADHQDAPMTAAGPTTEHGSEPAHGAFAEMPVLPHREDGATNHAPADQHMPQSPEAPSGDVSTTPHRDLGLPGSSGMSDMPDAASGQSFQPGGYQSGGRPPLREGNPRGQRPFGRGGQSGTQSGAPAQSGGQPGQPGRMYRTRFDRPAPGQQTPYGRNGTQNGSAGQGRSHQQGDQRDQRDRRGAGQSPAQHGQGGRQQAPQRGQGGRGGAPGRNDRNDRNDRNRGGQNTGYGPGYVIPGYGVPGYGGQGGYGQRDQRHDGDRQRQGQPRRAPVPAQPPVPVRTVEVEGVLWIRNNNNGEILDERGTLAQIATMNINDIRRMGLRSGDVVRGRAEERGTRRQIVAVDAINNGPAEQARERPTFESLTAISPRERIVLERGKVPLSPRIIDLFAPLGFGARALVVAPPKTGKTTFLRETAESVLTNYPDVLVMACLVGERPEEVTDLRTALEPRGGLVYAASFDEVQERHAWLVQVTIERAKRVAESGKHVVVLLDSLTRLARAENLTGRTMGRTLSGGIDAQALDTGRRAFGAARCLEEGGSLTIMAACLVDTGSRQDDVVYEEFKGTGNMEIYLSRELAQRRLFPAVDAVKSGTRREELLLSPEELRAATALRRRLADMPLQQATTQLLTVLERTSSNEALLQALEQSGWMKNA